MTDPAHSREVLKDWGFDDGAVHHLIGAGAVIDAW
jgi:hypothetical protein